MKSVMAFSDEMSKYKLSNSMIAVRKKIETSASYKALYGNRTLQYTASELSFYNEKIKKVYKDTYGSLYIENIDKAISPYDYSYIFKNKQYDIYKSFSALNKIFDATYKKQLDSILHEFTGSYEKQLQHVNSIFEPVSEIEFDTYFLDEEGNLSCEGEIIPKEKIQEIILNNICDLIDNIEKIKSDFRKEHKIIVFVATMYIGLCCLLGVSPVQPIIIGEQKIESFMNNYKSKYYVRKETVKVYENPTSKSKVIYHLSYGETVIAEENAKGWIMISITEEEEMYQGWVAKCNLINYEKAKLHAEDIEYEVE